MKSASHLLSSACICLFLAVITSRAEVRTFTSSAGTTLKAEFVSLIGDTVTVKKEDGTPLTLKLAAFSRTDQAWLQTQVVAPAGQNPEDMGISLTAKGYEVARKDAASFLQGMSQRTYAATLVEKAAQARAKVIEIGTIKTPSPKRAALSEAGFQWEIEPSLNEDRSDLNINMALSHATHQLALGTSTVPNGIHFLGIMDEWKKDSVLMVMLQTTGPAASAHAPQAKAEASKDATLYTRTFKTPPDFLTSGGVKRDAKEVLATAGLPFPEGAAAVYNSATSSLIVKNTRANLDLVQGLVDQLVKGLAATLPTSQTQIPAGLPATVTVTLQSIELSSRDPLIGQLRQATNLQAAALFQNAAAMVSRSTAKLNALQSISGRSGNRNVARNGKTTLEIEPVIAADRASVALTGQFIISSSSLPIQGTIPFGGTLFVGLIEKPVGKETVEAVFCHASAQWAEPRPAMPSSSPPSSGSNSGATNTSPASKAGKAITPEEIIIPLFDLRKATIAEAVERLQQESIKQDPNGKGITIELPERSTKAAEGIGLNISLARIPFLEALRYCAELSKLRIDKKGSRLTLLPLR